MPMTQLNFSNILAYASSVAFLLQLYDSIIASVDGILLWGSFSIVKFNSLKINYFTLLSSLLWSTVLIFWDF